MKDYTNLLRMLKTYEDGYGLYQDAAAAIEELLSMVNDLEMDRRMLQLELYKEARK